MEQSINGLHLTIDTTAKRESLVSMILLFMRAVKWQRLKDFSTRRSLLLRWAASHGLQGRRAAATSLHLLTLTRPQTLQSVRVAPLLWKLQTLEFAIGHVVTNLPIPSVPKHMQWQRK
eukprot:1492675-Amphidinium_carterae.1